jgi:predicted dehydrogenase
MLGPVARVTAEASRGFATRTVSSEPHAGQVIEVEVPTTVNGVLAFENGANVALTSSWDVWKHQRRPFEIYGSEGSMLVPDPNFFGGEVLVSAEGGDWQRLDIGGQPFGAPNRTLRSGAEVADYRIIGLLDMAMAVRHGRPHRASGALALHVLEVLEALGRASEEGRHITIQSPAQRPAPVPSGTDEAVFAS